VEESEHAEGKIEFLADGMGEFAKAIDMTLDGSATASGCARNAIPCWSRTAW